jgi:PAS domain S-box-containing protein
MTADKTLTAEEKERHRGREVVGVADSQQLDHEVRSALEDTSTLTGEKLFRSLVRHIASALRVQHVFVAEWTDDTKTTIRCLAFWSGNSFSENLEFDVAGTPHENLRPNEVRYHGQWVQKLYAGDKRLAELRAESYIGMHILDSSGEVIGHLAALHDKPLPFRAEDEWILRVFAARAGVEIERKQTEERLQERDDRYALATAAAKIGVWDLDLQLGGFYLDPNVKALLGYTDEEIPNDLELWAEHIHPDDRDPVMRDVAATIEKGASEYVREHRMMHKDGSVRWIMARGRLIRDVTGQVVRMLGTDTDITERKRIEEALQSSEAKYRALVEQIPVITYIAELGQRNAALYVSPQIEALTGFSPDEWCVTPSLWRQQLHPEDRDAVLATLNRRLADERPFVSEYRLITKNDREIWIRDHGQVVRDDSRRPLCFQGVMIDITSEKRLQAELLESQKFESLGVLAGGIAHDFNNLLMPVLGHTSLALKELPSASPICDRLQQIEKATQRAADLTQQLLAYAGKGRFVVTLLDLNTVVEEMAHLLSTAISKKAVLNRHLADNLPGIETDATQLQQVIMNLITNASDALGDDSGAITLRTGVVDPGQPSNVDRLPEGLAAGVHVYLEVSDTGSGMDQDTQARIFDPFFTTKSLGRGLGLAAVQGIVRGHGGGIEVHSSPGRGTTMKVYFPATERRAESPVKTSDDHREGWQGRGTVLVVDDEESVRTVTRSMLEFTGFNVLTANDGLQSIEVLREHSDEIVAVLLDMTMPRMDGGDALPELLRAKPGVPVLLMSGYNEQEATSRFAGKGLAGFIQKPYRPGDLIEKLREILTT